GQRFGHDAGRSNAWSAALPSAGSVGWPALANQVTWTNRTRLATSLVRYAAESKFGWPSGHGTPFDDASVITPVPGAAASFRKSLAVFSLPNVTSATSTPAVPEPSVVS